MQGRSRSHNATPRQAPPHRPKKSDAKPLHPRPNSHIMARAGLVPWLRKNLDVPSQERPVAVKIVVCIKQVPARDSVLRLNSAATWVQEADLEL